MRNTKSETPHLTRAGRTIAEKTLAAAIFRPTSDGDRLTRNYEVHGIVVTESVCASVAPPSSIGLPGRRKDLHVKVKAATLAHERDETTQLTRSGRTLADATLAAATFVTMADGKTAVRQFEVYGVVVRECVHLEPVANTSKLTCAASKSQREC